MMTFTEMGRRVLLEKVIPHILEEPRRLGMEYWSADKFNNPSVFEDSILRNQRGDDVLVNDADLAAILKDAEPPCGTVACIAGWTKLLHGGRANGLSAAQFATKVFGGKKALADMEPWSDGPYRALFLTSHWPQQFRDKYNAIRENPELTPRQKARRLAQITVARIKYALRTGK